ncbi:hypothetical protein CEAn_00544 [Coxiella endosymbiont of Amblyomma nuttalli]|nr:hypothetical protein CEAn_00544 [Coxiella endosymbiont of Amblyomma nuttalli]
MHYTLIKLLHKFIRYNILSLSDVQRFDFYLVIFFLHPIVPALVILINKIYVRYLHIVVNCFVTLYEFLSRPL